MSRWSHLTLYIAEDLSSIDAYQLSVDIFKILGVEPKSFSSIIINPVRNAIEHQCLTAREMKRGLQSGLYRYFVWNDSREDCKASFACVPRLGRYCDIILGTFIKEEIKEKLDQIVILISQYIKIGYGISYTIKNNYDCDSYDSGLDYITLYPCEVSEPFYQATTTFTRDEHPAYFTSKLRMIYPYNVLNKHHMNMPINGQSLKQYITNDPHNGVLEQLNDYQYSWKLNRKSIHRLNRIFGQAGLLIGYNTNANSTQSYNMQGFFRK